MFDYSNLIKSIPQYLLFGSGLLASPPIGMVGYFHSGLTIKHKGPDLQLYISPGSSADYRNGYLNLKPELEELFERTPKNRSSLSLFSILLHPHSLGEIRLKSNDPFDHPLINPRYMNNDIDDKIQAEGLKIFINLMTSKTMSKYDPKLMEKPMPGCDHLKFLSDEYLACISRQRASTLFHPVGTCRMGTDKANSVVGPNLKVHGVLGLRIVDASVFPEQTSGNTAAPVIMVAEKASDLIKKDAQM
jgi:choline dehydrogenase